MSTSPSKRSNTDTLAADLINLATESCLGRLTVDGFSAGQLKDSDLEDNLCAHGVRDILKPKLEAFGVRTARFTIVDWYITENRDVEIRFRTRDGEISYERFVVQTLTDL
ncbi:hypothetical protein LTR17_005258 [Elasticomyces elasticus]|nr:hypothetical protein LTR17_005258 [Elasticomyces elasticus]